MFNRKKKIESNPDVRKPQNRLLGLFRSNDLFQGTPGSLENTDREDTFSEDHKLIRNAMLEFEYQTAKAQQALERNRHFC